MDLKEYFITQVFKIVADKVYGTVASIYTRDTDSIDLEIRRDILRIKQIDIGGVPLDECSSRQICETFISVYMRAEEDLKDHSIYEHFKTKTPSLKEIGADIYELQGLKETTRVRTIIRRGLDLSIKILELFQTKIPAELERLEEEKQREQKHFDF